MRYAGRFPVRRIYTGRRPVEGICAGVFLSAASGAPRDRTGFCSGSADRRGYFPAAMRIATCETKNMRYFSSTGMSGAVGNSSQALLPALEGLEDGDRSGL